MSVCACQSLRARAGACVLALAPAGENAGATHTVAVGLPRGRARARRRCLPRRRTAGTRRAKLTAAALEGGVVQRVGRAAVIVRAPGRDGGVDVGLPERESGKQHAPRQGAGRGGRVERTTRPRDVTPGDRPSLPRRLHPAFPDGTNCHHQHRYAAGKRALTMPNGGAPEKREWNAGMALCMRASSSRQRLAGSRGCPVRLSPRSLPRTPPALRPALLVLRSHRPAVPGSRLPAPRAGGGHRDRTGDGGGVHGGPARCLADQPARARMRAHAVRTMAHLRGARPGIPRRRTHACALLSATHIIVVVRGVTFGDGQCPSDTNQAVFGTYLAQYGNGQIDDSQWPHAA